jgi:hypothetical protein
MRGNHLLLPPFLNPKTQDCLMRGVSWQPPELEERKTILLQLFLIYLGWVCADLGLGLDQKFKFYNTFLVKRNSSSNLNFKNKSLTIMIEQIIHNLSPKFNFLNYHLKSTSKINKYHHASVVHSDISNKKKYLTYNFF